MDVIGDFRYADDEFKDQDDNLRLVNEESESLFICVGHHCKKIHCQDLLHFIFYDFFIKETVQRLK